jgi:hypothetical protein
MEEVVLLCSGPPNVERRWYHSSQPSTGEVSGAGSLIVVISNVSSTGQYECRSASNESAVFAIYWLLFEGQYFLKPSRNTTMCATPGEVVRVPVKFYIETGIKPDLCEVHWQTDINGNTTNNQSMVSLDDDGMAFVNLTFLEGSVTIHFECLVSMIPSHSRVVSSKITIQVCHSSENGTDSEAPSEDSNNVIAGAIAGAVLGVFLLGAFILVIIIIVIIIKIRKKNVQRAQQQRQQEEHINLQQEIGQGREPYPANDREPRPNHHQPPPDGSQKHEHTQTGER